MKEIKDKEYPVFSVSVSWKMGKPTIWDGKENWTNSTGFTWAFRRKFSVETVEKKVREQWWPKYRNSKKFKEKEQEPVSDLKITVKYLGMHSWWLRWFCHETFNTFETDEEAYESFLRWFGDNNFQFNYSDYGGYPTTPDFQYDKYGNRHVLMGAEDKYRWEVCHCEHCEKARNKRTIINH